MDERKFEELLGKAFEIEQYNESTREPSKKELDEAAPFTDKQLEYVRKVSRKEKKLPWTKYLGRVAAVILCISVSSFAVVLTDPDIRAMVSENIVKYIEEGFNIDFTEANDDTTVDISETVIGYIPEGFELLNDRTEEGKDSLSYSYMNSDGEYIVIDIIASSDIELITEDEHHDLKPCNIGYYTGYISYSETQSQGSVYFGNSCFTVAISGMTARDELVKIASNIEIKG